MTGFVTSPIASRTAWICGRSCGFTLISQLVALALVGMLLAIAVPEYMNMMPRVRLHGAARQVVSDLMFARMKAIREQNPHRVVFLSAETYQVLSEGAGIPVLTRDLSSDYRGVELVANNNPVFNAGGTASVLATIQVRNEAGEHRLSVNITGRVKMQ